MFDPEISGDRGHLQKILKILIVGETGTGKTTLIRQYVPAFFTEFYKSTIGVDFTSRDIEWDEHTSITLQLWDIAGQERCANMTHVYYQEAVGAFVVFDVQRPQTLDVATEFWKKDIDSKVFTSTDGPIPCLLLGNKIDLCRDGKWAKTAEEMQAVVEQHKFIGFFQTSARNGMNIDEAAKALVKYVLDNNIEPHGVQDDRGVDVSAPTARKKSGECC